MEHEARKRKRSSKRSSILKIGRSPPRGALCDLDPNADTKNLRLSRRVSFAETCQVKEFVKDSWNNSGQHAQADGGNADIQAKPTPSALDNENQEPSGNDVQPISGLDNLLNGQIRSTDSVGTPQLGPNIGDRQGQDDDVFLPDRTVVFQDGAELEITNCFTQQPTLSNNMTILSQSSMNLTLANNTVPGSSVSSDGNMTVLSSSDMDMTACVTSVMPNLVPGIMITRPSTEDEPNVTGHAVEKEDTKFSTAAFLKRIGTAGVELSSVDTVASTQKAGVETRPKIDVSQFLAKMTGSSNAATAQETKNPVIFVPDKPSNNQSGKIMIPKDPYTLSNETDFDTMINTTVNKYTALSCVSSVSESHANVATSQHRGATNQGPVQTRIPVGADESAYQNWSTETTRVFATGNTSRMEMTLMSGNGTVHNANEQSSEQFAVQLQSALQSAVKPDGETRIFTGDEDTADMDFTACLTTNMDQVRPSYNKTHLGQSAASPGDVTKCVNTDMEFTLCNITVKSHDDPPAVKVDSQPAAVKVDSQGFLKKLMGGSLAVAPNKAESDCSLDSTEINDKVAHSSKIDSQMFLSKLIRSGSGRQSVVVTGRERTTTEGSEDMEFTACLNQVPHNVCVDTNVTSGLGNKTTIFDHQENMEFTMCVTQTMSEMNNAELPKEQSPLMADKTQIFNSSDENMEFTKCIAQVMTNMHTVPENKVASPPTAGKTKIFNAAEENMEFTTCVAQAMQDIETTQRRKNSLDKTKLFEEHDMEFTTCLSQAAMNTQSIGSINEHLIAKETPNEDFDSEDSEIVFGKRPPIKDVKNDFSQKEQCRDTSDSPTQSRKRSLAIATTQIGADCENGDITLTALPAEEDRFVDKSPRLSIETGQEEDMISDQTEPTFPESPAKDQEVTTGLKGLLSKVKKARKSIGIGETTSLFNADMTLGQMELTTCAGGIDSRENTAKLTLLSGNQTELDDITHHFQNDDLTSAMELTKCITSTLPSLRDRLNEMTRSKNLGQEVAVAMALNKISQESVSYSTSQTLPESQGSFTADVTPIPPSKKIESLSSINSTESLGIMSEMPPSFVDISATAETDQEVNKQGDEAGDLCAPAPLDVHHESIPDTSVEEVRNVSKAEMSHSEIEFTEIHEMDDTKTDKSRLFSTESESTSTSKINDLSKGTEDESKESLLPFVETMNTFLGLLPENLSCLEPKVTKGLSSISFAEKDQLSLCDEPPKSIDDFLEMLGFHSYKERLCRRSTLAPYSMKAPETLGEHLELATVIEPKVQVYEWACNQMEIMTKKIQTSNEDVGATLLGSLPQLLIDVANPQTSSKTKQTCKPIVRSCKLKAEQTMKEWRGKMVKSELDALQEERLFMEKGIKQLRDGISSLDRQLENISSEKGKIMAVLAEIENEEPASDEQVEQFEDCEEQIVIATADVDEREAKMEYLQSQFQDVLKENEKLTEQMEVLRFKLDNCESPKAPATSVDDLHDQIDDIHLCTEWKLKSISENMIVISWLFDSLRMEIELAPSASNKTPQNRYLTGIKFVSQLADTAAPWAFLVQRMVTEAVSTRALDEKFPMTKHLGQMLEELSPIVWHARALGDEISDTCLFHDTIIDGCRVAIKFVSLAAFARFTVTFRLQPGKYPNESMEWDMDCDVGDMRRDDLDPVISACKPGQFYIHRLVKSIQHGLEKRAQGEF